MNGGFTGKPKDEMVGIIACDSFFPRHLVEAMTKRFQQEQRDGLRAILMDHDRPPPRFFPTGSGKLHSMDLAEPGSDRSALVVKHLGRTIDFIVIDDPVRFNDLEATQKMVEWHMGLRSKPVDDLEIEWVGYKPEAGIL